MPLDAPANKSFLLLLFKKEVLTSFLIVLLAGQLAMYLPDHLLGLRAADLRTHFVDRFFPFDAVWYQRISVDGYAWDPTDPLRMQDVAFFPLWSAFLFVAAHLGLPILAKRWLIVAVATAITVASVAAFQRLAGRLLPPPAARTAVWLFALYPAANFCFESYPTGLMNLLAVLAVLALMDKRFLTAALFSGLITGAGPLGLGTAMAVFVCAAADAKPLHKHLPRLIPLGLLSISGLLLFLTFQAIKFGDPFAFMTAQVAWESERPFLQRVTAMLLQLLVIPDVLSALHALKHVAHPPSIVWLQAAVQKSLYIAFQGAAVLSIAAAARLRCWPLLLQSSFTMLLFVWFHSALRPGNATFRLLYCAIGMFIGVAWLLRDRPLLSRAVIVLSATLLAGGAFFSVAGFYVV